MEQKKSYRKIHYDMNNANKKPCRDNGVIPMVNQSKREAKGDCVSVCPYGVFELRQRTAEELSELSFVGKIRARHHENLVGSPVHINLCKSCGYCVDSCPEKAIKLVPK